MEGSGSIKPPVPFGFRLPTEVGTSSPPTTVDFKTPPPEAEVATQEAESKTTATNSKWNDWLIAVWPAPAQWVLFITLVVCLAMMALRIIGDYSPSRTRPLEFQQGKLLTYKVDINKAPEGELMQIPGIGPKKAKAIARYREEKGPFQSLKELTNISGIGPKTLHRLREFAVIPGAEEELEQNNQDVTNSKGQPQVAVAESPQVTAKKPGWSEWTPEAIQLGDPLININTAPASELDKLPRIGPVLAKRIIDRRPYKNTLELLEVYGIGVKTLEGIRPFITLGK
ncbi:MAG: ComEA family DNA-binding protein [Gemmataceae bacterium]